MKPLGIGRPKTEAAIHNDKDDKVEKLVLRKVGDVYEWHSKGKSTGVRGTTEEDAIRAAKRKWKSFEQTKSIEPQGGRL